MLEDYLKIKNGQDLIKQGIVPKDSSTHMALITYRRLEALRDHILSNINDDMLGKWNPLVDPTLEMVGTEISDPDRIRQYAREGMRVKGSGWQDDNDLTDLEGTIKVVADQLGVEFDKPLPTKGHDLKGKAPCKDGHGWFVRPESLSLLIPDGTVIKEYKLAENVVANDQLGHKVRFSETYKGIMQDHSRRREVDVEIPKGTTGTLIDYNQERGDITINVDENLPGQGDRRNFVLTLKEAYQKIDSSSLGQLMPVDKEEEVRKQAFRDFFPTTVLETDISQLLLMTLLLGKDFVVYGPPGSGKTNVVKDIITLAEENQSILFTVDGCQVQCNPASLFDKEFAKELDACPECKIEYDPDFKRTNFFKRPKPKDVKVTVARYSSGKGIERILGTVALQRYHLAGHKIPKMTESGTDEKESDFDPEGYHAGYLSRTNNGILVVDELEKLMRQAQDCFLDALNDNETQPEQLRFKYPTHALIMATANNHTLLSGAMNDRMPFINIGYPDDVDTSYDITKRAFHKQVPESKKVKIDDTQTQKWVKLRHTVPMPATIEKTIDALYIKFRKEYDSESDNTGDSGEGILGSNRSKLDALAAARAKLLLDKLFFKETPNMATTEYAIEGVQYAFCTRVQGKNPLSEQKFKDELSQWVVENFSELQRKEEDTWWCRAYKHVAIAKTQIPEIESNFITEIKGYETHPLQAREAFRAVKKAYRNERDFGAQMAKISYPFMDYLFNEQPGFKHVTADQMEEMISYFVESRKNTTCKLEAEELQAEPQE
jgi:Mg-chelatase subunit ChlI